MTWITIVMYYYLGWFRMGMQELWWWCTKWYRCTRIWFTWFNDQCIIMSWWSHCWIRSGTCITIHTHTSCTIISYIIYHICHVMNNMMIMIGYRNSSLAWIPKGQGNQYQSNRIHLCMDTRFITTRQIGRQQRIRTIRFSISILYTISYHMIFIW